MLETTCCPDCGAELPTGATGGLCPRCLLGAGISGDSPFDLPADSPFAATTPQAGGFVPPTPASLAAFFPDLEVLEIIGQGGMGAVYKARQTKLDRLVALKIIRPESADDPAFAERFTREAKTLARLNHSNIVSIHDFGEFSGAQPDSTQGRTLYFFVMEFVDGANLRQLMESGRLKPAQSLAIVPQICDALQYAHDEGVIHRDIKPENILIDRRGRVKIADFGLAKLAGQSAENFTLTGTHQVMGTPRYMAPEQMSGSRRVDHRADIYSLGVVLYEMLTGELPMGRFEAPSHKAAVDARLDDVVHRALESNPDRRYQRASEIRTDMEAIAFDALSHGELESVGASVASGFPGPSTIMERQVAGVVNWFKGTRTPESGPQPVQISSSERSAIRQQVRWPAFTLMLYGLLYLFPALLLFTNGFDIADGNDETPWYIGVAMMVGSLLIVGLCGVVVRGGWNLLSLDQYRPAVVGALFGPPVGIWALTLLCRDEVRSAFTSGQSAPRGIVATLLLNTTLWGVLIAAGGVAVTFLPWAEVYNDLMGIPGIWVPAAGFGWTHGMIACSALLVGALFLLATATVKPVPIWRPLTVLILSGVVLASCGSFVSSLKDQSLAVQPLLSAAEWGMSINDRTPMTIDEANVATQVRYGPYLLMALAVGLLITAAFDFRLALQPAPAAAVPRRAWVSSPDARFSRKAIVGACWAPLFFLAAAGFMVTSEVMVQRPPEANVSLNFVGIAMTIVAAAVGILGLVAPFATTILGMLAISDIRQAPSRVRGLGLAYFDAILFPLLILDLVLLFGAGGLMSVLFQTVASLWLVVMLGGPICLILDAVIAVWGWRKVSRLPDDSHGVTARLDASGSVSSDSMPPAPPSRPADVPRLTPASGISSSITSVEFRRLELRLNAPAAGLMIVAFLNLLFCGVVGYTVLFEAWSLQHGRFTGSLGEVLGATVATIVVLLVLGTIVHGARHMRRLTGVGWCYAAAILSIIPWSLASIVGIPVGIWVLKVLGDADVKEAFVQRSLELEQRV